jgi:hypothetical protein
MIEILLIVVVCYSLAIDLPSYGSPCTPTQNPFLDFKTAVPPAKENCGSCLLVSECTAFKGRSVPKSGAFGCEKFPGDQIQCCTNKFVDDNSCQLDPSIKVFREVVRIAPVERPNSVNFVAGSMIITKASLLDTPQRYWAVIDEAIQAVSKVRETKQKLGSCLRWSFFGVVSRYVPVAIP